MSALAQSDIVELNNRPEKPKELKGDYQARPIALLFVGMDINRDKRLTKSELSREMDAEWRSLKPSISNKISAFKIQEWLR